MCNVTTAVRSYEKYYIVSTQSDKNHCWLPQPSHQVLPLLATELKNENHPEYVDDVTTYANVRDMTHLGGDFVPFWTFFDKFVPNVAGKKVWSNKVKILATITDSGCVMITDEAFTVVALENYWDRWYNQKTAKWTDSRHGKQQFMGWSDEAYTRYDEVCKRIKKQWSTKTSKGLEKEFKMRVPVMHM
jgi:hypothetical protein